MCALGKDFDAAITVVANPAGDAKDMRLTLDKPAKAYALDSAAHDETASFNGIRFQSCKVLKFQGSKDLKVTESLDL